MCVRELEKENQVSEFKNHLLTALLRQQIFIMLAKKVVRQVIASAQRLLKALVQFLLDRNKLANRTQEPHKRASFG